LTEFTPTDLAALDALYWAVFNRIKLQSTTFSLKGHKYQAAPMQSEARRICYMKGTQGGFSELEVLKTLWGLIHKRYRQGVLYMFPTTDDVLEFSKSRFNPLIANNPRTIGKFVKAGGKGTDTASLKKIGDAILYLRGARLSHSVGLGDTGKESSKLRGIPVDRCVFDEVDLMDEQVIAKAKGRMGHSTIKEEVYISNPTIPDYGIDKLWQKSDQRHLFRTCSCGHKTCAELSFPDCVHVKNGRGYIACDKCGKPVGLETVEWVPAILDTNLTMEGYRWSQLSSEFNDPAEILDEFNNPPQGNISDIYRLRLGLPHIPSEDRLTTGQVFACCEGDIMPSRHPGPSAMGVDVGKIKHVVIGLRTGKERFKILKVAHVSDWKDIHDLAKNYNVKSAVVDARPYEDAARMFQKEEDYRIFLCEYSESSIVGTNYNTDSGLVKQNRTEAFDATHRIIDEKRIVLPRRCSEVDEFASQCCNAAKVLETNKRSGTAIYRYRKVGSGGDHYRNALNYFYLAASGGKIATVGTSNHEPQDAISEYAII